MDFMDYTDVLNSINSQLGKIAEITSLQTQLTAYFIGIVVGGFVSIVILKGVFKNV